MNYEALKERMRAHSALKAGGAVASIESTDALIEDLWNEVLMLTATRPHEDSPETAEIECTCTGSSTVAENSVTTDFLSMPADLHS